MKIKTTEEVYKQYYNDCSCNFCLYYNKQRWVNANDLLKILKNESNGRDDIIKMIGENETNNKLW